MEAQDINKYEYTQSLASSIKKVNERIPLNITLDRKTVFSILFMLKQDNYNKLSEIIDIPDFLSSKNYFTSKEFTDYLKELILSDNSSFVADSIYGTQVSFQVQGNHSVNTVISYVHGEHFSKVSVCMNNSLNGDTNSPISLTITGTSVDEYVVREILLKWAKSFMQSFFEVMEDCPMNPIIKDLDIAPFSLIVNTPANETDAEGIFNAYKRYLARDSMSLRVSGEDSLVYITVYPEVTESLDINYKMDFQVFNHQKRLYMEHEGAFFQEEA